ncbi:MAG: glycosyltransferase family 87 protein [Chloroflexi bacterium]|nr:glycosyltransferase family 87 protein [Chloroflexota bacterium]
MAGLNKNINDLLIKVAWGVFSIIFIILICLAVLGGESITRTITPSSMWKPATTNPGYTFTKKLPIMGWSTLLFGGLITPSQIYVLENHSQLPNGKCNLAAIEEGLTGCYFANAEHIFFASTDKSSPKINGKAYEIAWRWKPSPFIISINALILLFLTRLLGHHYPTIANIIHKGKQKILSVPYSAWVFAGFLIAYWLFFFMPVFLNTVGTFNQDAYIPAGARIGMDQNEIVNVMVKPFFNGQTDFLVRGPYPPLLTVLYAPFTLMDPATSYATITIINLGIFLFLTLFLPWKIQGKLNPLVFLFIVSGLYSYGFHFEVERGQFNLLTIFFVFSAVWSFHYYPKFRLLSYLLFSIAIQFKVFPILFIICFVDDWRSWNTNIKRFIGLGVFNFALLFVLGYRNFFMFLENISGFAVRKFGGFSGHSVSPFINSLIGQLPENYTYLTNHSAIIGYSIIFGIIICLGIIIFLTYNSTFAVP